MTQGLAHGSEMKMMHIELGAWKNMYKEGRLYTKEVDMNKKNVEKERLR